MTDRQLELLAEYFTNDRVIMENSRLLDDPNHANAAQLFFTTRHALGAISDAVTREEMFKMMKGEL